MTHAIGVMVGNQKQFDDYAKRRLDELKVCHVTGRTPRQWRFSNDTVILLIDEYTLPIGWRLNELTFIPPGSPLAKYPRRLEEWQGKLVPGGKMVYVT